MRKKLLFVVDNLVMGGVTRALLNLLNVLDQEKYETHLLVLHYYEDVKIDLPENIRLIKGDKTYRYIDKALSEIKKEKNILALFGKLRLVFDLKTGFIHRRIRKSRKRLLRESYDVEIAYNDGFTQMMLASSGARRKISWLHADIQVFNDSKRYETQMKKVLRKPDVFVCVSERVKQAYESVYQIKNAVVIHNVMNCQEILDQGAEQVQIPFSKERMNLVSVGRLCEAKNYFRLARVHARLVSSGLPVNTYIVGDGLEKERLEKVIEELKIDDSFFLLGRKENPFPYVRNANLFVLSSDHEGLPTVLFEALILGVPCVTTDVAGAREIVINDCGIVTETDDDRFFEGICEALSAEKYAVLKSNAEVYQYDLSKILRKLDEVLCS